MKKSADRNSVHGAPSPGNQSRPLRRRLDNLPLPMFRVAPDGTILDVNRTGIRMLGYSRKADLVGRSLLSGIFAPASPDQVGELLKR